MTNNPDADRKAVIDYCQQNHISELNIPSKVIVTSEIPTLATGKIDYQTIKQASTEE